MIGYIKNDKYFKKYGFIEDDIIVGNSYVINNDRKLSLMTNGFIIWKNTDGMSTEDDYKIKNDIYEVEYIENERTYHEPYNKNLLISDNIIIKRKIEISEYPKYFTNCTFKDNYITSFKSKDGNMVNNYFDDDMNLIKTTFTIDGEIEIVHKAKYKNGLLIMRNFFDDIVYYDYDTNNNIICERTYNHKNILIDNKIHIYNNNKLVNTLFYKKDMDEKSCISVIYKDGLQSRNIYYDGHTIDFEYYPNGKQYRRIYSCGKIEETFYDEEGFYIETKEI